MFEYVLKNILARYSVEELSSRYQVEFPDMEKLESLVQNQPNGSMINGAFYEVLNRNGFKKQKGELASANIHMDQSAIVFRGRLGFFARLIEAIKKFFRELFQKLFALLLSLLPIEAIRRMIQNLLNSVPENVRNILQKIGMVLGAMMALPLIIIGIFWSAIAMVRRMPGGILGIIIGIMLAALVFIIQSISTIIGILMAPFINKIVDSMIDKPYVKNMVIGYFALQNNFDGTAVLSNALVSGVSFEVSKNLLGQEKLYVIIKEGNAKVSIEDFIYALFVPYYFINRQSVFVTDVANRAHFENILVQSH